ncbi:MAG: hypothetical protein FJ240_03750 [Nitrospira sp.]|nr:hypothetical protein [Nitrospira sp.]
MKKGNFAVLGVVITLVLILTGCATMGDVARSKAEGTSKVYPVTGDQAWDIAKAVFRWEGADAIEEHRKDNYMLTSSGVNLITYGAVMGAWIDTIDQNSTKVTVVTKRRIATNLATTLTEDTFHKRFAQAVEIIRAGKSLPVTPPN